MVAGKWEISCCTYSGVTSDLTTTQPKENDCRASGLIPPILRKHSSPPPGDRSVNSRISTFEKRPPGSNFDSRPCCPAGVVWDPKESPAEPFFGPKGRKMAPRGPQKSPFPVSNRYNHHLADWGNHHEEPHAHSPDRRPPPAPAHPEETQLPPPAHPEETHCADALTFPHSVHQNRAPLSDRPRYFRHHEIRCLPSISIDH